MLSTVAEVGLLVNTGVDDWSSGSGSQPTRERELAKSSTVVLTNVTGSATVIPAERFTPGVHSRRVREPLVWWPAEPVAWLARVRPHFTCLLMNQHRH